VIVDDPEELCVEVVVAEDAPPPVPVPVERAEPPVP
jgi:hypothetical protein